MQIAAGVLLLVAAVLGHRALGAAAGTKVIGLGAAAVMSLAAVGMFVLARLHPKLAEAGASRGDPVMPLGRMIASFGAMAVMWLYNLAVLVVLVVLTIRLL